MKFGRTSKESIYTERIKRMNVKLVFRCCKCGRLQETNKKNVEVAPTPPGTKYFCKECSGTGKAGVYKV